MGGCVEVGGFIGWGEERGGRKGEGLSVLGFSWDII